MRETRISQVLIFMLPKSFVLFSTFFYPVLYDVCFTMIKGSFTHHLYITAFTQDSTEPVELHIRKSLYNSIYLNSKFSHFGCLLHYGIT